jgi:peptidoglycan/xylan/chitin deacetylase (PgdA/CDA1 family)
MLSWGQMAEAAHEGIEIRAHSHQYPQLDQLPERLLREELYTGKAQLEDKLGSAVTELAYPFATPMQGSGRQHAMRVTPMAALSAT